MGLVQSLGLQKGQLPAINVCICMRERDQAYFMYICLLYVHSICICIRMRDRDQTYAEGARPEGTESAPRPNPPLASRPLPNHDRGPGGACRCIII
jgi:hypothetical protein